MGAAWRALELRAISTGGTASVSVGACLGSSAQGIRMMAAQRQCRVKPGKARQGKMVEASRWSDGRTILHQSNAVESAPQPTGTGREMLSLGEMEKRRRPIA